MKKFLRAAVLLLALSLLPGCSREMVATGTPSEQVEAGVDALRLFNFEEGYKILSAVQPELAPDSESWQLATYSLGLAAWHKTPPEQKALDEAKHYFEAVIAQDPDSNWAAAAMLDLGRMAEVSDFFGDPTDLPRARDYYEKVRQQFPRTEMETRATLYLAQSYAQTFEPENVDLAVEMLEEEMEAHPDSPWMGVLAQYTAQLYAFYLDQPEKGVDFYLNAVQAGLPRPSDADMSLWQLGLMSEKVGRDRLAAEMYVRILRDYPRSIYGTVAWQRAVAIVANDPDCGIVVPEQSNVGIGR